MLKGKPIKFTFLDHEDACAEKEWDGCCCSCSSHYVVTAHCLHVSHGAGCNCHEPMGFYVCTVFSDMGEGKEAQINGAHGYCECYQRRKTDEPT